MRSDGALKGRTNLSVGGVRVKLMWLSKAVAMVRRAKDDIDAQVGGLVDHLLAATSEGQKRTGGRSVKSRTLKGVGS